MNTFTSFDGIRIAYHDEGEGPAVIEEYGSTTLIGPGDRFEVGRLGELRISIRPRERG